MAMITVDSIQIKEGDKFKVTKHGEENGFGFYGETITIFRIFDSRTIGITSKNRNDSWGDLDGAVEPGHGYYVNPDAFRGENFECIDTRHMVSNAFEYNGINLKGKTCKMLYTTRDCSIGFVEFEENIGGGGCDGLGKSGHCIAIPLSLLGAPLSKKSNKMATKNKSDDINF